MSMEDLLAGGLSLTRPDTPDAPQAEDDLSSGLSLERPETAQEDETISVEAWEGPPGFSAGIPAEEVRLVAAIASNPEHEAVDRLVANHMLGLYYTDRKDFKRALYHIKLAASFAEGSGQKACCLIDQLHCQIAMNDRSTLAQEDLPLYDEWVEESMFGILEGSSDAIGRVLSYAEGWKDYGLAAAAALAWSTHSENVDAYDREEAEADYHRYKKQFEEQRAHNYSDLIYTRLPGEDRHGPPCRAVVRQEFLNSRVPLSPQILLLGNVAKASAPAAPAASKSYEEQQTDKLMERVEQFGRKYSQHARSLFSAKPAVLREYISLGQDIIMQLKLGNAPLMRAILSNPQVFEDMQDYLLLSSAATLWLIHPQNTDGREKISTEKRATLWLETADSLAGQLNDRQPMEWRLNELHMSEFSTYESVWTDLAKHVHEKISS